MFSASSPPSGIVEHSAKNIKSGSLFVGLFFLLLVLSIHGVRWIPFFKYTGLDLENLYVYHTHCGGWPIPYAKSGLECSDPLARSMVYPPLAYWMMGWIRFFPFGIAKTIWAVCIVVLTAIGMKISVTGKKIEIWRGLIAVLLFLQMPMVYALERGNIDALVVVSFMIGAGFFVKRRGFLAGFFFATAAWLKVYPALPALLILIAIFSNKSERRESFWPLFWGFILGGVLWGVVLLPDSIRYVLEVLPAFASERGGFGASSHTLFRGLPSLFLKIPLLVLWTFWLSRFLKRDPMFALCGALAISTFFQNISNDYNFITAYPFLFLVMIRLLRQGMSGVDFGVLVSTYLVFVGDRTPLEWILPNRGALFIQIFWMIGFPVFMVKRIDRESSLEGNTISS